MELSVSGDRLLRSARQTQWCSYYRSPGLRQPHRQMALHAAELLWRLLLYTGMSKGDDNKGVFLEDHSHRG